MTAGAFPALLDTKGTRSAALRWKEGTISPKPPWSRRRVAAVWAFGVDLAVARLTVSPSDGLGRAAGAPVLEDVAVALGPVPGPVASAEVYRGRDFGADLLLSPL